MKPIGKILGFGLLGCLVCCGGPVALLLLGGMGVGAALGELMNCYHHPLSVAIGWVGAATCFVLVLSKWRARRAAKCACSLVISESQGKRSETMASLPIVCALTLADFKTRLADISSLTRDALISGWRDDLALYLRYRPEEEGRVRRMVEHEQECCAFLSFNLRSAPDAIELWITAPEAARAVIEPIDARFVGAHRL